MTRLSVCGLGVSCNEMNDTPMLLVVPTDNVMEPEVKSTYHIWRNHIEDQPIEDFVPAECNDLMYLIYVCMYV